MPVSFQAYPYFSYKTTHAFQKNVPAIYATSDVAQHVQVIYVRFQSAQNYPIKGSNWDRFLTISIQTKSISINMYKVAFYDIYLRRVHTVRQGSAVFLKLS